MTESPGFERYPGAAQDTLWRSLVFPANHRNPQTDHRYHLLVVGAGPAGLICALAAAGLGARVALIERNAMGGDCLNVGCVPSKTLLEASRRCPGADGFDDAFATMRAVRAAIAVHDSVERYTDAGVDVFLGEAAFVGRDTVQVGDRHLRARRIVIATGARPALPPIPGLAEAAPLSNETVFDLRERPGRLAIIGAGPIGCELAQALVRLGVRVTLLDAATRPLPAESPAASDAIAAALAADGVDLRMGASIREVRRIGPETRIELDGSSIDVDRVLAATGRRANVERLGLDRAGVGLSANGLIAVDERLRTTNRRIFAAGDVCSETMFTHSADAQARVAVQNALFAPTASTARLVIPHCTYTSPEVAQIGLHRGNLGAAAARCTIHAVALNELDRGRAAGDTGGIAEIVIDARRGRILGATIVAEHAGDLIVPVCVAMSNGLSIAELGRTVIPYPTRSEYIRRIADASNRARLTPLLRRLLHAWLRLTDR
jgi:pyruvate/2-oxoglutarate dehydrogenase complex dihydrolipoamide dehydrogenase (E3) component